MVGTTSAESLSFFLDSLGYCMVVLTGRLDTFGCTDPALELSFFLDSLGYCMVVLTGRLDTFGCTDPALERYGANSSN